VELLLLEQFENELLNTLPVFYSLKRQIEVLYRVHYRPLLQGGYVVGFGKILMQLWVYYSFLFIYFFDFFSHFLLLNSEKDIV
jgi:hypothetical protein